MWKKYKRQTAAILSCLCALCMLTGFATTVRAAETEEKTVRIGYIGYDGFINREQDGTYSGYGVEFLKEISKYTGWKYEYVFDSWENHLQSLRDGKIDFVCHAQKTKERENEFLFSKYSIGAESSVLYVRSNDDRYYYNDFSHFDGMRIAFLKNSFQNQEFEEYAKEKHFDFQYMEYNTQADCFEALDTGEVDAVAMGSLALKTDYKIVCRFGSDPFYFMSGKQNQPLLAQLNDALGQITAYSANFGAELYKKYYGNVISKELLFTREEAEYIANAEPITFSCIPNRRPFSFQDTDGQIKGITIDILKLIEERSGLHFKYELMPVGARTPEILAENPQAIIPGVLTANPEFRDEKYVVTKSFYSDSVALACLSGKNYNVTAEDESYTLVIPRSYMGLETYIRTNYPQFEIVYEQDIEECLRMLNRGEVDFFAQNVNTIRPYLQKPHYEKVQIIPTFFMNEDTGIVANNTPENRVLLGIIDKCIATISEKEISQFTVDHTVANAYRLTWGDMIYKFRYPLVVIAILVAAVIGTMTAYVIQRSRSYRRMAEKNQQLAEAVAEADRANQAKSMFLARMSHEIRTPLNAIVGLTALAKKQKENSAQVEEYLGKIEVSSKILLSIINDVLDMSALEGNKLKIAEKPFDLQEILNAITTMYEAQCRQKGIDYVVKLEQVEHKYLIGDELRLNQILLNLVSNAYKFTPVGGRITVTVEKKQSDEEKVTYDFKVEDTGEGMTPDMIKRLFLPFEQEDAGTAQKHGGSGLGLSIAKNLVDLMGGTISCESEKGKGTVFTVSLPFTVDKVQEAAEKSGKTGTAAECMTQCDFGGRKVLLAEDTAMNAEIMTALLELVNMKADHAWNGKEAVELFTHAPAGTYVAVLMDIQMPEMNGYEAARAIRASSHSEAASIPMIAMTANSFSEDITMALDAGMNGHIAKPIDTKVLYETLKVLTEA